MSFDLTSWLHRKRVQAEVRFSGREVQAHRVNNPFHAVSILAGPTCQRTAIEFKGRRFLSTEAPVLPLPTCNHETCRCRYVHHEDRRSGRDRRHRDVWNPASPMVRDDRRASHGRRVTDH